MIEKVAFVIMTSFVLFVFKHKLYRTARVVQYCYKFFVLYFFITINSLILMPCFIWNGKNVKNAFLMAEVSKNVKKLLGINWHLRNPEIVAEDRGAVIILNHQSAVDLLGLCNLWHAWAKASVVVKKELFYLWPFGLGLYLMDFIFVDRGSRKSATSLQNKADEIMKKKIKLLVFPEGTRNSDNTKLLPFKKGAFNMAVAAQVPIIPIVMSRYYFIDKKKLIFGSGNVLAQCLEPIPTAGLTLDDVPELINKVQSNMENVYTELSKEVAYLPINYFVKT